MASIPQRVSTTLQQQRMSFLQNTKQNRFKYRDYLPGVVPVPGLDPALIPQIIADQPEYWMDDNWEQRFAQRLATGEGIYFGPPAGFPGSIDDYQPTHTPLPQHGSLPHVPSLRDDLSFAAQRLSGANPLAIERVVDLADYAGRLAIEQKHVHPDVKLDQAIDEGRLYIVDYSFLQPFAGSTDGSYAFPVFFGAKWLTAPIALFHWEGDFDHTGRLRPLAIQLRPTPAAHVYTPLGAQQPTHPNNWLAAKAAFQVADAHVHEWDSHLVRTHLTLGPFAVSSERRLHDEHPVLVMLRPHLRYTLGINSRTDDLTGEGSYGDVILAPSHDLLLELLVTVHKRYRFEVGGSARRELESRRMLDAPIPYPFRDDGLPVDDAIRDYIGNYLRIYYRDSEVATDPELQNFIKELRDPGGGALGNLTPGGGSVDSIDDLTDLISSVLWTAGPLHSAVNYAQWGYMADARNQPTAGYIDADVGPTGNLGGDPVTFFPQYDKAKVQSALMYVLGTWRMDLLGYYRPKDFLDADALKVIADFQCALARVGADTVQRDSPRRFSYPYLIPWNITNSTNV